MFWKTWVPKFHLLNMCGQVTRLNQLCEYWLVLHPLEDENIVGKTRIQMFSIYCSQWCILFLFVLIWKTTCNRMCVCFSFGLHMIWDMQWHSFQMHDAIFCNDQKGKKITKWFIISHFEEQQQTCPSCHLNSPIVIWCVYELLLRLAVSSQLFCPLDKAHQLVYLQYLILFLLNFMNVGMLLTLGM